MEMEKAIKELNHLTDEATKHLLNRVVEKKRKFDRLKHHHFLIMWVTIFSAFLFFYYLYKTVIFPYSYSFEAMFSSFVNDSLNVYILVITVGLFGFMNVVREKRDKAEDEYHALRCEIIDKSKDLWKKENAWETRHIVFEMMKKLYDINLYHESK